MVETLKWVIPYLPEEKPRHLLGIGKVEDIFNAVEQGIDLFDCVIPTREARHGRIYTKNGHFDISKHKNKNIPLEKGCGWPPFFQKKKHNSKTQKNLKIKKKTIEKIGKKEKFNGWGWLWWGLFFFF